MSSPDSGAQPLGRRALTDQVYEELLASLVDGRHEAGDALSIDGLARELQVSPTPVREALARLEATGLVTRIAMRGYRVAPTLSAVELAELIDARLAIEPVNALRACKRATPGLIQALDRSIADLRKVPTATPSARYRDYWQADRRFHDLIAETADNRFLLMAYNCLGGQVQRFRLFTGLGATDAQDAIKEHTAILGAFRSGEPKSARRSMIRHLRGVKARGIRDIAAHG